uniref:Uncharacterized protein n=1 Tax=Periophthalmus magnuspinnatus TaxID=409849 RepID=A0A3B3ZZS2_9GOBI
MSLKLPRNWDFSTFKETTRIARSKSVFPGDSGQGGGSPGSPTSMERPLKSGWLKKQQRSLVKNWQQRYFVLRGSTLTYHKDDKESTCVTIYSSSCLIASLNQSGIYIFSGPKGDRERCSHVLMASSQGDMEEWVRTLRRVIGAPTSGVFGKSLADTVAYDQRFGPQMVPILVQKCVEFIQEHGLSEEGIFRLPGQDNAVRQFRGAFDAGERPSFPSDTDVHTVASLLKLYLRELPEPVVPWTQYQDFLDCTNSLDSPGQTKLEKQIALLPRVNYNLLSYICRFLFEVQMHSKVNKMNVENLATVMGINLLKPQIEDPITVMKATPQIQKLMTVLIRQHEALFPTSKDELPSPPPNKADSQKNAPRSFVGWESTEVELSTELCDTSLSESPEEEEEQDSPGPLRSTNSKLEFLPSTQECMGSPRKRTQTLPTFNCPLTGMAAKAEALNRWSRIQENIEEKSGTFSEDIFKILDLKSSGSLFKTTTLSTKEEEEVGSKHRRGSDQGFITIAEDGKVKRQSDCVEKPVQSSANQNSDEKPKVTNQETSKCEENQELKATVAELRSELEAERRRVAALEICLKNAERSRDEAQRRNLELQNDVQRFLTMKTPP